MDQTLIQEILEVVEQAAIASARLTGLGQKDEADAAAVEAMRKRMGSIEMQGKIVIGEGELGNRHRAFFEKTLTLKQFLF